MNWKEHLTGIAMEECAEVALEIIKKNSPQQELNDLLAVFEMLQEVESFEITPIKTQESILINVLNLQYYLSKSLRFGFDDSHHETGIPNKKEIEKIISELIMIFPEDKEQKQRKKEKVLLFSEYSKKKNCLS